MVAPTPPCCPDCGKPTSADQTAGLCALCLLQTALTPGGWGLDEESAMQDDGCLPLADGYRLLRVIGEGGFGMVYEALQLGPIRRKVALKVLKPGTATAQILARFEAERQALALMDHPHIARVHDAGETDDGRPFIAMELVEGVCIDEHLRGQSEAVKLSLFISVCRAVAHAHRRGVIHRDLKPSNLLIDRSDPKHPQPKVIDFGVAKALDAPLTEAPMFTALRQLVGTPAYMSPEQLSAQGSLTDTRTDIFALGRILRELLTGEVPRPGESSPVQLPRELEWICQKATHQDADRRYASADELAEDVERYLDGRAVKAGPESLFYHLGKWMAQHRLATAGAVVVLVTVALSLSAMMVSFRRTREALKNEEEARQISAVTELEMRRSFSRSDFEMGLQLAERGRPNAAIAQWARALRTDPENEAAAMQILSTIAWQDFIRPTGPVVPMGDSFVRQIKVSADGRSVAVIQSSPGTGVRLFRWIQGTTAFAEMPMDQRGIMHSIGVANGGRLYLTDVEGSFNLIDESGRSSAAQAHPGAIACLAVSPDGKRVLTAGGRAVIWRNQAGVPVGQPVRVESTIVMAAATAEADKLVIGLENGELRQLNFGQGGALLAFSEPRPAAALAIRASDGLIAASYADGSLRTSRGTPPRLGGAAQSLAFSADGDTLVAEIPGSLQVIDARTWQVVAQIPLETALKRWAIAADSKRLVTLLSNGVMRAWNLEKPTEFEDLLPLVPNAELGLDPSGSFCAVTGSKPQLMRVYDLRSHEQAPEIQQRPANEVFIAVDDATGRLWTSTLSGKTRPLQPSAESWDIGSLNTQRKHAVVALNLSLGLALHCANSSQLTLVSKKGLLQKWTGSLINAVALSPDGTLAAAARTDGLVDVWETSSGKRLSQFTAHSIPALSIAFVGRDRLVTGSLDRSARLFDWRQGISVAPAMTCDGPVICVTASRSGERIATSTLLGRCRLWSGRTGQPLSPILKASKPIVALALHPQETRLWALASNGVLHEWHLPPSPATSGDWLPAWAEATVGEKLNHEGTLVIDPSAPPDGLPESAAPALQQWLRSLEGSPEK